MDKKVVVNEWIKYSNHDLEAVHQLLTHRPLKVEIISYLCQQSAEKMLKAFWHYSDIEPPRTHDLALLNDRCITIDASFSDLRKECNRLNSYSGQPRYPFELEITEEDMHLAIKSCEKISEFVKAKIIFEELETTEDRL